MDTPVTASTITATPSTIEHRFQFNGSGGEYFRIWIVNLLLTLITLGIYGAWAKVRRLRYFYGNTSVAGSSFEYHGEPKKILKGRAIAGALILPYYLLQTTYPLWSLLFLALFIVALPFIIVKSRQFQMRMTSWRNIRFGFDGTYGGAAKNYLGLALLVPLTLGMIIPYMLFSKQRFIIGNTRFGQTRFEFGATPGPYYKAVLSASGWFLLALIGWIGLLVVLALIFGAAVGAIGQIMTDPRVLLSSPGSIILVAIFIVLFYVSLLAVMFIPAGIATARITNTAMNHSTIGTHSLRSELQANKLVGIYLTNLLGIVFTLGLYSPWAKVRLVRYQLENTTLIASGNLDEFVATETSQMSAAGEELGDFLDVDFGL